VEQEIVINLVGTGYDINIGTIPKDIITKITTSSVNDGGQPNYYKLFELDFYKKNHFLKSNGNDKIHSWKDINDDNTISGPNMFEMSQVEIWVNGKRKKTLKYDDLYPKNTLFPPYNIISDTELNIYQNKECAIIGHQLKGLIKKYQFKTKKFSLDSLEFSVISFNDKWPNMKIVNKLIYKDATLKELYSDALVTGTIIKFI
jgi:hypothetical protein